jgi:hypothetical protein
MAVMTTSDVLLGIYSIGRLNLRRVYSSEYKRGNNQQSIERQAR